ncbi:MAG: hypothetical protein CBC48_12365 [bacterium TMED88]|nr:MAG: hypothetical protein CBC48_12365 [bacterium TMED88]
MACSFNDALWFAAMVAVFEAGTGTKRSTARSTRLEEAVNLVVIWPSFIVPENSLAAMKGSSVAARAAIAGFPVARIAGALESRRLRTMSDFSAQSKTQATSVALVSPLSNAYVVARVQLTMPAVPFNCQHTIGLGPLRGVHSTPMGRIMP